LVGYLSSPAVVGEGILREILGADRALVEVKEVGVEWTRPATYVFAISSTNWNPAGLEVADRYPEALRIAESWVDEFLPDNRRSLDPGRCRIAWKQFPSERTLTYIVEYEKGRYFLVVKR